MVSASSAAGKYSQPVQPAPRGTSAHEKAKCSDEKAILAFTSQKNGNGSAKKELGQAGDADQIIEGLKAENEELRRLLAAAEESLVAGKGDDWSELEREHTRMLEEKTDVIRELHLKIQELQRPTPEEPQSSAPPEDDAAELCALSDELEHERKQLREDEKSLMQQMRAMEVQMSRERADLARQRADIERLHQTVRDELEQASRESSLRERLAPLMRQQSQLIRNGNAAPPARSKEVQPEAPRSVAAEPANTSGIFRRIFGK